MALQPPTCMETHGIPKQLLKQVENLKGQLVLVTGGTGFLGGHIVSVLLQAGCRVRVFDIVAPRKYEAWKEGEVEMVVGNLLNDQQLSDALKGVNICIHVASPPPTSNDAKLFQSVNVDGTRQLIAACKAAGCNRFVYTSSASVVFTGAHQLNLDETAPPPLSSMDAYTKSKLHGEQLVLQSTDNNFFTVAIRPHGIFGARDPHFLPVLAKTGAAGKSKYQIGSGNNLVDFTYVENVAWAHMLAASKLTRGATLCGNAYFITNCQPIFFWEFIGQLQESWGYPLPSLVLPVKMMKPMAKFLEFIGGIFKFKPTFTTQAVNYAGSFHYYSSAKASRDFNYYPAIGLKEAMNRSLNYYWNLRNEKLDQARLIEAREAAKNPDKPYQIPSEPFFSSWSFVIGLLVMLTVFSITRCSPVTKYIIWAIELYYIFSLYKSSAFGQTINEYKHPQSLKNKQVFITGGNRGIGYSTVVEFAKLGASVTFTSRDLKKGEEVATAVQQQYSAANITCVQLDLASFDSCQQLVNQLKKKKTQFDFIIHNAGAMVPNSTTKDGFNTQFQANYLSSYYLTDLLLSNNLIAPAGRVVHVSSLMHRLVSSSSFRPHSLNTASPLSSLDMYNTTKLCQILYSARLQREMNQTAEQARLEGNQQEMNRRTSIALNPGAVGTDFIDAFLPHFVSQLIQPLLNLTIQKTPQQAAQSVVWACVSPVLANVGGVYVDNCRVELPSHVAQNTHVQDQLWNLSKKWCKL